MARDFRARVMQALLENPGVTVNSICAIVEGAAFMEGREGNDIARYRAEFSALARDGKIINVAPDGSVRKLWIVAPDAKWRAMKSATPRSESLPVASPLICDDDRWPTRQAPAGFVEAAIASITELERAWRTIPSSPSS